MFTRLSELQAAAGRWTPVHPTLPSVLTAAMPAFERGFAYSASHWNGELTVTLHYQGAELGSSAPASPTSYSDTCARLLAGLLGIPLLEGDQPAEAEPLELAPVTCGLKAVPDPVEPEPQAAQAPAAEEEEPDEFEAVEPAPAADTTRPLSDEEKATAIEMIKTMAPDRRKEFTKVFRATFQVPAEAKQVAPFIQQLQHLQFIDRYTVEAHGGIAA